MLLVHGFGAFANHFRFNIQEVADKGFDVYAVTLVSILSGDNTARVYPSIVPGILVMGYAGPRA